MLLIFSYKNIIILILRQRVSNLQGSNHPHLSPNAGLNSWPMSKAFKICDSKQAMNLPPKFKPSATNQPVITSAKFIPFYFLASMLSKEWFSASHDFACRWQISNGKSIRDNYCKIFPLLFSCFNSFTRIKLLSFYFDHYLIESKNHSIPISSKFHSLDFTMCG